MKRTKDPLISRVSFLIGFVLLLTACAESKPGAGGLQNKQSLNDSDRLSTTGERYQDYKIVTLLPRDAIPAIDNPRFVSVDEANESYSDDELVLGVNLNGDVRAYSIPMLSSHEIVNDNVGGVKISVTW